MLSDSNKSSGTHASGQLAGIHDRHRALETTGKVAVVLTFACCFVSLAVLVVMGVLAVWM